MTESDPHAPARRLLHAQHGGVLSTLSVELDGHPFGSIVPYCLDGDGAPVILISDIAQHTKNVVADPRASLLVAAEAGGEMQAAGRLTCIAEARRLPDDAPVAERYTRFFPHSRGYHQAHAFGFWRLEPSRFRYIGGFGDIRWIEPEEMLLPNPFAGDTETGIVQHMNEDHGDAIRHYLALAGVEPGERPQLAGIDGEGIDIVTEAGVVRIDLGRRIESAAEARGALVELARADALPTAATA